MMGYCRNCLKNYEDIAQLLVEMAKKYISDSIPLGWGATKGIWSTQWYSVYSDTVLSYPRQNCGYILYSGVCAYTLGAVLGQIADEGIEQVVQYISTTLKDQRKTGWNPNIWFQEYIVPDTEEKVLHHVPLEAHGIDSEELMIEQQRNVPELFHSLSDKHLIHNRLLY